MSDSETVEFIERDSETVVLIEEEAYRLDPEDIKLHNFEDRDTLAILTYTDYYIVEEDEDGWLILSEDVPEKVQTFLREETSKRFADADVQDFPLDFEFSYTTEYAIYSSAWRNEKVRQSSELIDKLPEVKTVTFEAQLHEDGSLTITDFRFWPSRGARKLELDL